MGGKVNLGLTLLFALELVARAAVILAAVYSPLYISDVRGKVNLGLTLLFALELVVNMFAHWFREFWQSGCCIISVEIIIIITIIIIIII